MRHFNRISQVLHIVLLVLITAANAYFYWLNLRPVKRELPITMMIADSIRTIQVRKKMLTDSIAILDKTKQTLYAKQDSVMRLDSAERADYRQSMRAKIRADVRAGL